MGEYSPVMSDSWVLYGDEVQCNLAGNGHAYVLGLHRDVGWPVQAVGDHKRMGTERRWCALRALHRWLDANPHVIACASFGKDQVRTYGVATALKRAFWRAVRRATRHGYPHLLLIDGTGPGVDGYHRPQARIARAEERYFGVAAAGLLARERRDHDLRRLHTRYPEYGFPWNDASGSNRRHLEALVRYGLTPSHHERETLAALQSQGLEQRRCR